MHIARLCHWHYILFSSQATVKTVILYMCVRCLQIRDGLHYNPYFPGGAIAMPKMLNDGAVEYEDGTPATEAQVGRAVCF